jgi:hypothetical protein
MGVKGGFSKAFRGVYQISTRLPSSFITAGTDYSKRVRKAVKILKHLPEIK